MRHIAALLLLTAAVAAGAQTAGQSVVSKEPIIAPTTGLMIYVSPPEVSSFIACYQTNGTSFTDCSLEGRIEDIANLIQKQDREKETLNASLCAKDAEIAKLKRQLAAARKRNAQFCVDLKHQNIVVPNCYIGQPPSGPGSR
jgi:septal ring factor EnvC (AmiA/AmiB activator)